MKIVEFIAGTTQIFPREYYERENVHFIQSNYTDKITYKCLRDDQGDNISQYGKYLAEYTALYYVWKNFNLNDFDTVKFSTYRKPFALSNSVLSEKMCRYDSIVTKIYQQRLPLVLGGSNVGKDMLDRFLSSYSKFNNDVHEFLKYEQIGHFYPCTSFVVDKKCFYSLCEFIFPTLIDFVQNNEMKFKTAGALGEDITSYFLYKTLKNPFFCPLKIYNYPSKCKNNNQPVLFGEFTTEMDDYNVYYSTYENPLWNTENSEYFCNFGIMKNIRLTTKDKNFI